MKTCSKCETTKPIKEFPLKNGNPYSWCNVCNRAHVQKYRRTQNGLIRLIYTHQIHTSVKRNHPPPAYSINWLLNWVKAQPIFQKLFVEWEKNNYSNTLTPSIDRINDNFPYTEINIQIVTWNINRSNGRKSYRKEIDPKIGREVYKCAPNTKEILEYFPNIAKASESVGCTMGEISRVCVGKRKTARNFYWKYK